MWSENGYIAESIGVFCAINRFGPVYNYMQGLDGDAHGTSSRRQSMRPVTGCLPLYVCLTCCKYDM